MKDRLAGMSPVAQANYLGQENALLQGGLQDAAQKLYKMRQEITGGLQVIWSLAKRNGGTLEIPASDLITAGGKLARSHDVERDVYIFRAIDPTNEEIEKLAAELGVEVVDKQPAVDAVYDETSAPSSEGSIVA